MFVVMLAMGGLVAGICVLAMLVGAFVSPWFYAGLGLAALLFYFAYLIRQSDEQLWPKQGDEPEAQAREGDWPPAPNKPRRH